MGPIESTTGATGEPLAADDGAALAGDTFVSYASADRNEVTLLVRGLRRRGVDAWFDVDMIDLGDRWRQAVLDGAANVRDAVVVIGPGGLGRIQREEIALLLDRRTDEPDFRLVPVFLEPPTGPLGGDGIVAQLRTISSAVALDGLDDATFDRLADQLRGVGSEAEVSRLGPCPYPGLHAFGATTEDAERFHGRGRELDEIAGRLVTRGAVCIWGASGIGKSSVARAGIEKLRASGRLSPRDAEAVVVELGTYPLDAVATALGVDDLDAPSTLRRALVKRAEAGAGVCLVVDQLEAMFAPSSDPTQRTRLSELLGEVLERPPPDVTVVLTIRSDAAGLLNEEPVLASVLAEIGFTIGPIDRAGLVDAIQLPGWAAGARFEPGLVDTMVDRVIGQPNGLPLLAVLLERMWESASGDTLTLASYRLRGGLEGVLDQFAGRTVAPFRTTDEALVRWLLLRLVELHDHGPPTRRPVRRSDLMPDDDRRSGVAERLVDHLIEDRLVVAAQGAGDAAVVQFAHDSVLVSWSTLRCWIEVEQHEQPTMRRLRDTAVEWDEAGRPGDALSPRRRLAEIEAALASAPTVLTRIESDYVARSRRRRRLRAVAVAAAAVVALLASVAVTVSQISAREERASRELGEVLRLAATAEQVQDERPDLGLLLAREAALRRPEPEAVAALASTLSSNPQPLRFWDTGTPFGRAVMIHDDDGGVAVLGTDGGSGIRLCDVTRETCSPWLAGMAEVVSLDVAQDARIGVAVLASGRVVAGPIDGTPVELEGVSDARVVAVHPSEPIVVIGGASGEVRLLRIDAPDISQELGRLDGPVRALDVDPGLRWVAASDGRTIDILSTGGAPTIDAVVTGNLTAVEFTNDGSSVLIGDEDRGDLIVVDLDRVAAGDEDGATRRLSGHRGGAESIVVADGTAVSSGPDSAVRVWDLGRFVQVGSPFTALAAGDADGRSGFAGAALDLGGSLLIAARRDGVIVTWDAAGRSALARNTGATAAPVIDLAGYDGGVAVLTADGSVTRYDGRGAAIGSTASGVGRPAAIAVSPDGKLTAVVGDDIEIIDATGNQRTIPVGVDRDPNGSLAAAFVPGRSQLVIGDGNGAIRIVDVVTGRTEAVLAATALEATGRGVRDLDVSADGALFAVAVASPDDGSVPLDARIRLISIDDLGIRFLAGHRREVETLTWSPDGRLYSGSDDRTILAWDPAEPAPLATFVGHSDRVTRLVVADSGGMVVSASEDATLRLWTTGGRPIGDPLRWGDDVVDALDVVGPTGVVSSQPDGLIWWTVDIAEWLDLACNIAGRPLTSRELDTYVPDPPANTCTPGPPSDVAPERWPPTSRPNG